NSPALPPSTGKSEPNRSRMSVCIQLIRTTVCPEAAASADTKLVFPTPGLPSSKTALPHPK
ncbi:hypothetical protein SELMODRAFT_103036, partial [Selaginella moellendorffii]